MTRGWVGLKKGIFRVTSFLNGPLSVSFGDRPSGGIAIAALRKTAKISREQYPEAAQVLLNNVYMDDIIDSFSTHAQTLRVSEDIDNILKSGNFNVKGWVLYNGEEKLNRRRKLEEDEEKINGSCESIHKVLGLSWDSKTDCFKYFQDNETIARYTAQCSNALLTKRIILSLVNGIYDPLGLISPVIIKAKILLKKLWLYKIGWDDPVPNEIISDWVKFCFNIPMVKKLSLNRCMKPINAIGDPIMITFCDASELAFGSCTYFRWLTTDGSYHTQLVASKSRVSPSKVQSIVRLEVCGAVLGKRLAQFIENHTRYSIQRRYFIVDSEVVRSMIEKQSYGYNTFIATRIGEIQEHTIPSEWFWVESEANIADWITRGKEVMRLVPTANGKGAQDF